MTLVRPQVVIGGFGKPGPRGSIGAKGMQIYGPGGMWWSKRAVIFRNPPYTIESPHQGQVEGRINFGEAASRLKGTRGFSEGLPAVAAGVRSAVTGFRAPSRIPEEAYPSKVHPCFHSLAELKAMKRVVAAPVAPAAPLGIR